MPDPTDHLLQLLPLLTGAETKVLLAEIAHEAPTALTTSQLVKATGLSPRAVRYARRRACRRGLYVRRGPLYILNLNGHGPRELQASPDNLSPQQSAFLDQLCDFGLVRAIALDLLASHPIDYLHRHLQYATDARDAGIARNPAGWLVISAREDRGPPLVAKKLPWYHGYEHLIQS